MTKERQPLADDSWSADKALFAIDDSIESICNEFASKLHAGQAVTIEDVLNETNGPDRTMLISQLILIEFRHRWIRGETPSLDDYLSRFPAETETIQGLVPQIEKMARRFSLALMETVVKPEVLKSIGHFQIREVLGRGSFGTVWQAWDTKLRRHVAIKSITHYDDPARDLPMAMHEAHAVASLHHPNIVRIFDVEEIDDRLCLVSEYVEGVNLGKELADGLLDFKKSAFICQRIAEALQHAHEHGVIHRDIKPSNILINANGEPLLTDFGVAKYSHADKTLSDEGKVVGSVRYMSPEQSRSGIVDGRSDVYSLGVVLYELITGRPPFTGSIKEAMFSHQFRDPRSPRAVNPKIPKDLETICLKAMSKNSKERYQTAREMGEDLELYMAGESIQAKPLSRGKRWMRSLRRRPGYTLSTCVAFILLASTVALGAYQFQKEGPHTHGKWNVMVETEPNGADVMILPAKADGSFGDLSKSAQIKSSPGEIWLEPGNYIWIAFYEDGRISQGDRHIPTIGTSMCYGADNCQFWRLVPGREQTITTRRLIAPPNQFGTVWVTIAGTDKLNGVIDVKRRISDFALSVLEYSLKDYMQIRRQLPIRYRDKPFNPVEPLLCTQTKARHWAEESGGRMASLHEIEYAITYLRWRLEHPKSELPNLPPPTPEELANQNLLLNSLLDDIPEWTTTVQPLEAEHNPSLAWTQNYPAVAFQQSPERIDEIRAFSIENNQDGIIGFRVAKSLWLEQLIPEHTRVSKP